MSWFWRACAAVIFAVALTPVPQRALALNRARLVRDILPGPNGADPMIAGVLDGALLFSADDGTHGRELWRSDGTAAGTWLVRDIRPGPEPGMGYASFATFGGFIAFSASDGRGGAQLWRTDGSEAGTKLVRDTEPAFPRATLGLLTPVGGRLWFMVQSGFYDPEARGAHTLWASDLTPEGTMPLAELGFWEPGFSGGTASVASLTPFKGTALVARKDEFECCEQIFLHIVAPDGMPVSPYLYSRNMGGHFYPLRAVTPLVAGETAYFTDDDPFGSSGPELWRTDGTPAGTTQIALGQAGYGLDPLGTLGTDLLLTLPDAEGHLKVYRATPLDPSIRPLADLGAAYPIFPGTLATPDAIYFLVRRSDADELWRTDTTSGPTLVFRFVSAVGSASNVRVLTAAADQVMLRVGDPEEEGTVLWVSGGTPETTRAVGRVPLGTDIGATLATDSLVYLRVYDGEHGAELWVMDRAVQPPECAGDCNGNASVTIDEVVTAVNVALGRASPDDCSFADSDFDLQVTIDEIVAAVYAGLHGCAG